MALEDISTYIPYYLTKNQKEGIVKALEDFPNNINYFTTAHSNELLQGDGWKGLSIVNIESMEKKLIQGIILSNSCDISDENTRAIPAKLVFAPICKLKDYENLLKKSSLQEARIEDKLKSIKEQKITSIFYLPASGSFEESIICLDDLHSIPADYLHKGYRDKDSNIEKIFTLSQVGFYLFLFKLSIHFCRFHENVQRDIM